MASFTHLLSPRDVDLAEVSCPGLGLSPLRQRVHGGAGQFFSPPPDGRILRMHACV